MLNLRSQARFLARVCLCLALAFATLGAQRPAPAPSPASAPAASLLVDRNDDAVVTPCSAAANDCTLRGAIQKANTNGVVDVITFSTSMTITYLSQGIPLTATGTTIQGAPGQRISINANNTGNVFRIRADDITIDGLRMYGSAAGSSIIWIGDSAQRIRLANNVIGDDDPSILNPCGGSLTAFTGVYINSSADPIGADAVAWIYGNFVRCIAGLPGHGILVHGAREVIIGADALGSAGAAQRNYVESNYGDGVYLALGATDNIIRNSALQYNHGNGLVIDDSNSNDLFGNYFQANDKAGIVVTNTSVLNQIGCPSGTLDPNDPDLVNHIQQNDSHGVHISGASTTFNSVLCNRIGAEGGPTPDAGNHGDGIRIDRGASFNAIGEDGGTRNVISGNDGFGINITGANTSNNLVQGNYIGTIISGTEALPNFAGILLEKGASFNTVGGPIGINRNLIAGNTGAGIVIQDSTTATNTVINNHIGINGIAGTLPLPNGGQGIVMANDTHGNIIGSISNPNQISYNDDDGILLTNAAFSNQIRANVIMSNAGNGIQFYGSNTAFNVISQTLIAHNTFDGIAENEDSTLNTWTRLVTYGNGGLGIDKNTTSNLGDIPDTPFPVITAVNAATGQLTGTASAFALVEVYLAYPNPSGMGEGYSYVGTAAADGSGDWSLSVEPGGSCYTAFQTADFLTFTSSSEFGPTTCRVLAVDRNDDVGGLACTGAPLDCSLRSAVQIANTDGVDTLITFSTSMTIDYVSAGQPLTATDTTILGAPGQVISINANNTGSVFHIRANDITLDGLHMYGSAAGNPIIWISNMAQRIKIANNEIGDDHIAIDEPCTTSPTAHSGIYINSSANPAGPDAVAWIYGNVIGCIGGIPGHGIMVAGSREVVIGADALGNSGGAQINASQFNAGDGVHLQGGATANIIQNSSLRFNAGNGLVVDNSDNNKVYGNYVYINHLAGIVLTNTAQVNQLGCPSGTLDPNDPEFVNHITLNGSHGVHISGVGTISNQILCNLIGASDGATPAAGNHGDGIRVDRGAQLNAIGVDGGTRNVIGDNDGDGIQLAGSGTSHNLVQGNYIGTNISGTAALANGYYGIKLVDGPAFNTIGGDLGVNGNLIAGNTAGGIVIQGGTTATNTVINNDIGVNADAGNLRLPNIGQGIVLAYETHGNIIGGVGGQNQVAFNGDNGIFLTSGPYLNQILANSVYSNAGNGIEFYGANTVFNVISQTVIAYNHFDGIAEGNGATLNVWEHISTFGNGGLGIDKNAPNNLDDIPDLPYPVITYVDASTGQIAGTASANSLIEVYRADPNWSGMGEGKIYEGTAFSNGAGDWTISVAPGNSCYTAFQTEGFIIYASSEFGPHTCQVYVLFMPVIFK